jgi:hypothetical protein
LGVKDRGKPVLYTCCLYIQAKNGHIDVFFYTNIQQKCSCCCCWFFSSLSSNVHKEKKKFICKRETKKKTEITDETMTGTVIYRIVDIQIYTEETKDMKLFFNVIHKKRKTRTINQINTQTTVS